MNKEDQKKIMMIMINKKMDINKMFNVNNNDNIIKLLLLIALEILYKNKSIFYKILK